jgi:hypothetical protein
MRVTNPSHLPELYASFGGYVGPRVVQVNLPPAGQTTLMAIPLLHPSRITTDLGYPAQDGDQVQTYAGGYTTYVFDETAGSWLPSEPVLGVAESFWITRASSSPTNLTVSRY